MAVTNPNLPGSAHLLKIFGKTEKEPLDVEAWGTAFEKLAQDINTPQDKKLPLDEIIYRFVDLFNLRFFLLVCYSAPQYIGSPRSRSRRAGLFVH